jgi:predicted  nucleic acid-binding Zn-ribbon protein
MSRNQLTDAAQATAYILAGKAIVTLVSTKTGTRFTFKIKRGKGDTAPHFISLLSGPDNTSDYRYMATIFSGKDLRWTAKSTVNSDTPSSKAFAWAWGKLIQGVMPAGLEVWHEGRCGKCGRRLTVPESILTGLGPECSAVAGVARVKSLRAPKAKSKADKKAAEAAKEVAQTPVAEDIEAEMQRIEADGDREQTRREEQAKWEARKQMESGTREEEIARWRARQGLGCVVVM